MWGSAPGPWPAESETEEGGEDEGGLSLPGPARSGWVSGLGRPHSPMSVSPFHRQNQTPRPSPCSSSQHHLPPKSNPQNKIIVYSVDAQGLIDLGYKALDAIHFQAKVKS